jgi:hypothetical protein
LSEGSARLLPASGHDSPLRNMAVWCGKSTSKASWEEEFGAVLPFPPGLPDGLESRPCPLHLVGTGVRDASRLIDPRNPPRHQGGSAPLWTGILTGSQLTLSRHSLGTIFYTQACQPSRRFARSTEHAERAVRLPHSLAITTSLHYSLVFTTSSASGLNHSVHRLCMAISYERLSIG